jgi:hypothetical protein
MDKNVDLVQTSRKRPRTVRTIPAESAPECPRPLAGEGKGEGAYFITGPCAPNPRDVWPGISRPHPDPLPRGGRGQSSIASWGTLRTGRRDRSTEWRSNFFFPLGLLDRRTEFCYGVFRRSFVTPFSLCSPPAPPISPTAIALATASVILPAPALCQAFDKRFVS